MTRYSFASSISHRHSGADRCKGMTVAIYREAKWLKEIHEVLANGALALIAFHVVGALLASFEHRENLVKSMFTSLKRAK